MVANDTIQTEVNNGIVSATVVRLQPLHNGHKRFLVEWARKGKMIVMIGSCYENGEEKNCIPASEREKMVRAVYKRAGISESQFEIITQEDTETFDEWISNVKEACNKYGVTHFITGNKEDILDVLAQRGESLGAEMINPEDGSDFPYHATDIRKLIIEGNYEELEKLIPDEVKPILFKYSFKEIIACSKNQGIRFVKGRQTIDIIMLVRNTLDSKIYVLLGRRSKEKVDFQGYLGLIGDEIKKFETPMKAVVRTCKKVVGLEIKVLDNSLEPAIIRFSNVPNSSLEQLHTIGIYSSEEEKYAGTRGGSSQCFGVFIEDDISKYEKYLNSSDTSFSDVKFYEISEVLGQELAYQQTEMLEKAITMFNAYPKLTQKH
jgi:nicotinamide mononucleotide adenylyltransferase